MNNKTYYPRLQRLENELKGLEHRGYADFTDGMVAESERQAARVRAKIRNFKPTEKDKAEALEYLYRLREIANNEIAQLEAAIIELGGRT